MSRFNNHIEQKIILLALTTLLALSVSGQHDTAFYKRYPKDSVVYLDLQVPKPKTDAAPGKKLVPYGWTNDFADILTREQIFSLDSAISNFEKETSIEIAIVTIDSSFSDKGKFDEYITYLSGEWGVGKKDLHNGILIGVSAALRKMRISNGYGISERLSDAETKSVIDNVILPEFRNGSYFNGLMKGIMALMDILRKQ